MSDYPIAVGELDPNSCYVLRSRNYCSTSWGYMPDTGSSYGCSRPNGHEGPHVSHRMGVVLAIMPSPIPDYLQVSEGL